jgi:hypothetical protein
MSITIDENSKFPSYDSFNILGTYKIPFVILLIIIILVYIFLFSLLNNATMDNPASKWWVLLLEIILFGTLIVIVALNVKLLNDKHYSFTLSLKHLFDSMPEIDVDVNGDISGNDASGNDASVNDASGNSSSENSTTQNCTTTAEDDENEVFNIPNNTYTYSQAQEVCSSLDARLATLDEVEEAYKKGANWCSYGWSEDQLALFPTQKSVYNELKKTKNHSRDCGRPGVNGGHFPNKSTKFGVNCYGKKPYRSDKDKQYQESYRYSPAYPDSAYEQVEDQVNDYLIAPFNKTKWSEDD